MKTIAAIDIGSYKVCALVAEVDNYGEIQAVGIGEARSQGIEKGSVVKLDSASKAIQKAIREAEEMSGHRIDSVIISVSGPNIKSQNEKETINISPQPTEIDFSVIDRIMERVIAKAKEESYDIIHTIPRRYTLDDQEGILDPIGFIGSKIETQVHIVKAGYTSLKNLERAVSLSDYKINAKVFGGIAAAEAVLLAEEKEEGCLLLDIGHSLTNFVLYLEGSPAVSGTVLGGGYHITKDISHFIKIPTEDAERIKIENGWALVELVDDSDKIKIKPRGEEKEALISKKQLAEVIQVRLEDIMERVIMSINNSNINLDNINAGIVVCGGSSKLNGIKDFLERYFELPVRIGYPHGINGLKEKLQDPSYAVLVGSILYGQHLKENPSQVVIQPSSKNSSMRRNQGFFSSIIYKLKSILRDLA